MAPQDNAETEQDKNEPLVQRLLRFLIESDLGELVFPLVGCAILGGIWVAFRAHPTITLGSASGGITAISTWWFLRLSRRTDLPLWGRLAWGIGLPVVAIVAVAFAAFAYCGC